MATKSRRWWERLLLVINLVVANAVAAVWIATFLQPRVLGADLGPAGEVLGEGRLVVVPLTTTAAYLALIGCIGLLLWNFAWLVRRREHHVQSTWVISESSAGPVRIAREAIESALRTAGEALPEVTRLRVQVDHQSPKRIRVTGQFHCAEGQNHLNASQRLRHALLERFGELVHLGDGSDVGFELEFQGFAGKLDKNAAEVLPPPDAEAAPFTGPKYPIDDDGIGSRS